MKFKRDELIALTVAGIGPVTEAVDRLEKTMLPEFDEDDRTRTDAWKIMLYIITAYLRMGGENVGDTKGEIEVELALQSKAVDARLSRLVDIGLIEIVEWPLDKVDGRTRRVKPTEEAMERFEKYGTAMIHAILHYADFIKRLNFDIPNFEPENPSDEFVVVLPDGVASVVFEDFDSEEEDE